MPMLPPPIRPKVRFLPLSDVSLVAATLIVRFHYVTE
jgi:hypothetical protein